MRTAIPGSHEDTLCAHCSRGPTRRAWGQSLHLTWTRDPHQMPEPTTPVTPSPPADGDFPAAIYRSPAPAGGGRSDFMCPVVLGRHSSAVNSKNVMIPTSQPREGQGPAQGHRAGARQSQAYVTPGDKRVAAPLRAAQPGSRSWERPRVRRQWARSTDGGLPAPPGAPSPSSENNKPPPRGAARTRLLRRRVKHTREPGVPKCTLHGSVCTRPTPGRTSQVK